ncbi:hypothetical protein P8452_47497 [Trifolium repens]|nr:hypothetical protein P8452_47497 [Trifolium repens]
MGSSYEDARKERMEENRKRLEALNLPNISRSLFKLPSITKPSKINKNIGLEPKLKIDKEGELPKVKSSKELARLYQIKHEKIQRNMEQSNARVAGSKEHVSKQNKTQATNIVRSKAEGLDKQPLLKIAPQAQIKLSNFVTSGQKDLISDKDLDSAKKKVGSKIPTQLKGTSQNHGPKKVANEALMTKSKGSMQNHNPQKQPMTKVVIEEVESPMKITVGENDNSRSKQNPKKRVGDKDDETMASQQNATKKTKGCKSMLMVDFLKEHNELGDEELENEEDDDDEELENENEDQEENGENNGNDRIFICFVCFIFMRIVFRNTIGLL